MDKINIEHILKFEKKSGKAYVHTHNVWEFILACSGEGIIQVDDTTYSFKKGTVVCIPPGSVHYNYSENPYTHMAIRFKNYIKFPWTNSFSFNDDNVSTLERLGAVVLNLFYSVNEEENESLNLLCEALLSLILNMASEDIINPEVSFLKKVISSNYTNPEFNVSVAFENINYSDGHLRRLFYKEMNMMPMAFLTKLRIEHAAKMLENPNFNEKISVIAFNSGFYDVGYFSRVFKKYYKMSPNEYRKTKGKNS